VGAPNVWRTYFPDMGQRHWSPQDIASDPALSQIFGQRQPARGKPDSPPGSPPQRSTLILRRRWRKDFVSAGI